jgi:hypothetical protein
LPVTNAGIDGSGAVGKHHEIKGDDGIATVGGCDRPGVSS